MEVDIDKFAGGDELEIGVFPWQLDNFREIDRFLEPAVFLRQVDEGFIRNGEGASTSSKGSR